MEKKVIITIGRQFGSGGREIGQKLAKALGVGYYDKELMSIAAKESGLCEDVFTKADEQTPGGLDYAISMGFSYLGGFTPYPNVLSNDGLFQLQSEAIRNLVKRESCVIVGRCADYILREDPALISFFLHNSTENRIQRIVNDEHITVEEARELMAKTDKSRAAYYNYYTNKIWGMSLSYNYSIDVSVLGVDESVSLISDMIARKV